jgi:hypothetical protein
MRLRRRDVAADHRNGPSRRLKQPVAHLRGVVFPHPEGPTRTTTAPSDASKLRAVTARAVVPGKAFDAAARLNMGVADMALRLADQVGA